MAVLLIDPKAYAKALNTAANQIAEYRFFQPRSPDGNPPLPLREREYSDHSGPHDAAGFLIVQAYKHRLFAKYSNIESVIAEQLGQPSPSIRAFLALRKFMSDPSTPLERSYEGDARFVRSIADLLGAVGETIETPAEIIALEPPASDNSDNISETFGEPIFSNPKVKELHDAILKANGSGKSKRQIAREITGESKATFRKAKSLLASRDRSLKKARERKQ